MAGTGAQVGSEPKLLRSVGPVLPRLEVFNCPQESLPRLAETLRATAFDGLIEDCLNSLRRRVHREPQNMNSKQN